jgi:signal transduction histidine kinase
MRATQGTDTLSQQLDTKDRELRALQTVFTFQTAALDTLVSATDREQLLPAFLDAVRAAGRWTLATYWEVRGNALVAAAVRGCPDDETRDVLDVLREQRTTWPAPWMLPTVSAGEPEWDRRVAELGDRQLDALLRAAKLQTALRIPVRTRGTVIGVVELYSVLDVPAPDGMLSAARLVGGRLGETLDRLEYTRAQENARRQAEAAMQAKSAFLATMSHEIRTPLHGVLGLTALLLETPLSEQQRQYAETAHRAGSALLALLNDVLDLSKIEAGRLEVERIAFEPSRVIDDVVSAFAHVAHGKKLGLEVRVAPSASKSVLGDPTRLRQIMFNLVGNAVKFTVAGNVSIVADSVTPGRLRVSVADTGIGISPDVLPNIFRSFTQSDPTVPRRFGGSGLGLAIAQHLASLLGGRIDVTSKVGVGSTFVLDIPAESARPISSTPSLDAASLPKLRVIVVDDQRVNLLVATGMLQRLGQTVTTASSGKEAIERLKTEEVDLVFMDCMMPELDGYDTARALRATGFDRPIVAFTARERQFEAHAFRAAGMDDIITKPATQRDIANVIRRHARGS